jgi:hypothetical protein
MRLTLGISCETRLNNASLTLPATSKIPGFRQLHALVLRLVDPSGVGVLLYVPHVLNDTNTPM